MIIQLSGNGVLFDFSLDDGEDFKQRFGHVRLMYRFG